MLRSTNYLSLLKRCFLIVILTLYYTASTESFEKYNFYSENTLKGVHERALSLNGIRSVEMIATPREGSSSGIVVRQLSNGRQVVNLIYNGVPSYLVQDVRFTEERDDSSLIGTDEDGLNLRECKVEKNSDQVNDFLKTFDEKANILYNNDKVGLVGTETLNITHIRIRGNQEDSLPSYFESLTKFKEAKHTCFTLNRRLRKLTKESLRQQEDNPSILKRRRRGLRELFVLPGTKWCGRGRLAKSYNDLDGYMVADHCCRVHDLCPSSIQRLSRKFGLYNYGLTTISHCSCDKRFKTCLKQTGTGASHVVGNVFFSVIKSNCFHFKRKKVCKKRGFWNCLKWGYEKQAVIRKPIPWNQ